MRRAKAAACVLVASAAGAAAGYPHSASFWGGLFFSGCLAALIGGLADWFAVTALFRRPLGIAYRTEVIPRNRKRLLREILVFVSEDILRPRNILRVVKRYNLAALLLLYFERDEGKEKVRLLCDRLAAFAMQRADKRALAELLAETARSQAARMRLEGAMLARLRQTLAAGEAEEIAAFLLGEAQRALREPAVYGMLATVIGEVMDAYARRQARRQWLGLLLDWSPDALAAAGQAQLIAYLEALKNPAHPRRQAFAEWLGAQSAQWAAAGFAPLWRRLDAQLAARLAAELEAWLDGEGGYLAEKLRRLLVAQLEAFKRDPALQAALDRRLKLYAARLARSRHGMLTALIEERLAQFTDESLASFLEERVADDLQMIRINGSAVGAAAGMALYLIRACAESVW